jgi:hypothetical protein
MAVRSRRPSAMRRSSLGPCEASVERGELEMDRAAGAVSLPSSSRTGLSARSPLAGLAPRSLFRAGDTGRRSDENDAGIDSACRPRNDPRLAGYIGSRMNHRNCEDDGTPRVVYPGAWGGQQLLIVAVLLYRYFDLPESVRKETWDRRWRSRRCRRIERKPIVPLRVMHWGWPGLGNDGPCWLRGTGGRCRA